MRHPLVFPVQPFSFLLLLAWHVGVHGPEANMAQHSAAKHESPNFSFQAGFVLKEQYAIIVRGCMNKAKVTSFGLMAMEASAF